jgi:hypothetical protein
MTRKESTRFGIKVLSTLKRATGAAADSASDEGKDNLSGGEDSDGDDGVSLPVRYNETGLHPSGSNGLLETAGHGSGQNSKASLTPSEELAFTQAFSASAAVVDMDRGGELNGGESGDQGEGSGGSEGDEAERRAHSEAEASDDEDSNGVGGDHDHVDTVEEQDLSEQEVPAEDGEDWGEEGDSGDGYDDSDDDSYEWERAIEYTGDRTEQRATPASQRQYAAQLVGVAAAVSSGADGDSIFGSRTHSCSDKDDENAAGDGAASASGSDPSADFAQFTAKATAWAGGVREHTLAVAMYDLALNDHKSDTSDGNL